jgi:hypothetical protein
MLELGGLWVLVWVIALPLQLLSLIALWLQLRATLDLGSVRWKLRYEPLLITTIMFKFFVLRTFCDI